MPLVLVLSLGVVEVGYALLDQHVVTKLTREGSNLISRDASLQDAATAHAEHEQPPREFRHALAADLLGDQEGSTVGTANYNRDILYQRYAYGSLSASSTLTTAGSGSFGPAPDYQATNSDTNTSLQVTNLPANLLVPGGMLYITEIFTTHDLITPFNRLGVIVPNRLYSIAYF